MTVLFDTIFETGLYRVPSKLQNPTVLSRESSYLELNGHLFRALVDFCRWLPLFGYPPLRFTWDPISTSFINSVSCLITLFLSFFSPKQRFDETRCSCQCLNDSAKQNCYNKPGSWHWDENSCQCMCKPREEWKNCGTGYSFDAFNTCECIIDHLIASPELIILIIILVFGLLLAAGTIMFCHKHKFGIFKNQRRDHVLEKIRKSSQESQKSQQNQSPLITWKNQLKYEQGLEIHRLELHGPCRYTVFHWVQKVLRYTDLFSEKLKLYSFLIILQSLLKVTEVARCLSCASFFWTQKPFISRPWCTYLKFSKIKGVIMFWIYTIMWYGQL